MTRLPNQCFLAAVLLLHVPSSLPAQETTHSNVSESTAERDARLAWRQEAKLLDGGATLQTQTTDEGVIVSLPSEAPDQHASVVVLKVNGTLEVQANLPTVGKDGRLILTADRAYINNNEGSADAGLRSHDGTPHIGNWLDGEATVEWAFRAKKAWDYAVRAVMSVEKPKTRFGIAVDGQPLMVEVKSTGGYGQYVEKTPGIIRIKQPAELTLRVKPDADAWEPINLRQVELRLQTP